MTLYSRMVALSFVAVHWITMYFEIILNLIQKSLIGLLDAHRPSTWLFAQRNTVPWSKKMSAEVKNYSYPIVYYPETNSFTLNGRGADGVKGKFGDVVTVELVNSDRILSFDMSSFFHEVSWVGGRNLAPSLYEITLVYFLNKNMVFTTESMKGFSLEVLTADGMEYKVALSSNASLENFKGWEIFGSIPEEEDEEADAKADADADADAEAVA